MILDVNTMLDAMVNEQIKISHLEKKVESKVIAVDKMPKKLKDVITKEYDAKLLKDADYIIAFYEKEQEEKQEDNEEGEEQSDAENTETTSDETSSEENNAEDQEAEKEEQVNEGIKVQDLTKTMLLTPKAPKIKTPGVSKTSKTKKADSKCCKDDKCEDNIEEAETEATGEELRSKVSTKVLDKIFKSQITESNKVELYDIKSTKENCYFCKITIKTRDSQTTDNN